MPKATPEKKPDVRELKEGDVVGRIDGALLDRWAQANEWERRAEQAAVEACAISSKARACLENAWNEVCWETGLAASRSALSVRGLQAELVIGKGGPHPVGTMFIAKK